MASVFIGGTSIAGGSGSVFGTLFGAYVIGSLEAGVVATTISGYWVQVVEGVVMAAVIVLNAATGKGNLAALSSRFRLLRVPASANSAQELLRKDDTAPN
jgi:simple sugar transport system permease protein